MYVQIGIYIIIIVIEVFLENLLYGVENIYELFFFCVFCFLNFKEIVINRQGVLVLFIIYKYENEILFIYNFFDQ